MSKRLMWWKTYFYFRTVDVSIELIFTAKYSSSDNVMWALSLQRSLNWDRKWWEQMYAKISARLMTEVQSLFHHEGRVAKFEMTIFEIILLLIFQKHHNWSLNWCSLENNFEPCIINIFYCYLLYKKYFWSLETKKTKNNSVVVYK